MQRPAATVCTVTCMLLLLIAHVTVQGRGRSWQLLIMLAHVQDDVVRPRRTWEQQQMKTAVPFTACSAKYGRAAAPRAAPICPGKTLAAGRANSEHSHGEAAAFEAVATCPSKTIFADCVSPACPGAAAADARAAPSPGHLPAADGGAVAIALVAVKLQETVPEKSAPKEVVAKKGSAINLAPQDVSVTEVVPTSDVAKGTSGKGHAGHISKGKKR
jgi:hypothetical protein